MKRNSLSDWIILLTLLLLFASCGPQSSTEKGVANTLDTTLSSNVIYGTDGRQDIYQLTDDRLRQLADSTVALMKTADLTTSNSIVSFRTRPFGSSMNLCSDEKFREQETAAFCSGTLVGPDLVLTAGHCIESLADCQSTSFVFGFAVKSAGALPKSVNASEVYRCSQIIKTQRVNNGADFAIVQLDRRVTNHTPLSPRGAGEVEQNASLVVIGHPVGLPTKVTTGGRVRSLANSDYFVADLDTFGGNSGSAVINLATGLIEGVLVRGEQDFENRGNCVASKVCAEGTCRGEDVTRISVVKAFLPGQNPTPNPTPSEKFTSNTKVSIPDNNQQGVLSSLQVGSIPKGRKVVVRVEIKHPYIGDLVVKLISASGESVTLHQRAGGSTDDLVKSYDVTATLGKVSTAGTYKLIVQDLAAQDTGSLISWSVEFQ